MTAVDGAEVVGTPYPRLAVVLELGPDDAGRAEAALPPGMADLGDRLKAAGTDGLALLAEAALRALDYLLDTVDTLEPDDDEPGPLHLEEPGP